MRKTLLLLGLLNRTEGAGKSVKPWRAYHQAQMASHHRTRPSEERKFYQMSVDRFHNDTSTDKILILNWWGKPKPEIKQRDMCGNCWVTNDKRFEFEADGIIIDNTRYLQHHGQQHPDQKNRNQDQYWIFWAREAASKGVDHGGRVMKGSWDATFNLTASYRRDSDIPRPFGAKNDVIRSVRYQNGVLAQSNEEHISVIMNRKNPPNTKYVSWVVSNCNKTAGASQRFEYGKRLVAAGLKLDGYGECWNNTLIKSPWTHGINDEPGIIAKYKFYLAFENSMHCNDYVSEKFWRNSLHEGAVPIVFGPHPDDVREMAPEKSYIHVEDFNSPGELVKYLNYLDNNDTAYLEYHSWRNEVPNFDIPAMGGTDKMLCGACDEIRKRKANGYPKRMIKSVSSWWWMNTHDELCIQGAYVPEWLSSIQPPVSMSDNAYTGKDVSLLEHISPKRRKRSLRQSQNAK